MEMDFLFSNSFFIFLTGTGHLNEGFLTTTEVIVLLIMWDSIPRNVVSTSGSSGIVGSLIL